MENIAKLLENIHSDRQFDFVDGLKNAYPDSHILLVGGIVRDALVGRDNKDYDFVIERIPIDDLTNNLKSYGTVIEIESRNFGVIKFVPKGQKFPFDLAVPRTERYEAGKRIHHAEMKIKNVTLEEDFSRRDFTINAIGLVINSVIPAPIVIGVNSGGISRSPIGSGMTNLYDPFGGAEDIKNKIIRAVRDPEERFREDPTRILRGIRLAATLGFSIESKTLAAMETSRSEIVKKFVDERGRQIPRVSAEMIGQEIAKTLSADPVEFLDLFDRTQLLELLLPEVAAMKGLEQPVEWHSEGDAFVHTRLLLKSLPHSSLELKLAGLLHDIGKVTTKESSRATTRDLGVNQSTIHFYGHDKVSAGLAGKILRRYCFENNVIDNVAWLIGNHMRIMTFPKMRLFKQKEMARHPLFADLIKLAEADDLATVPTTAVKAEFLPAVYKVLDQIKEDEKKGKPKEILNGHEIIEFLKSEKSDFDPKKEGKLIGSLKRKVNQAYDEGEIKTKEEALEWLRKQE